MKRAIFFLSFIAVTTLLALGTACNRKAELDPKAKAIAQIDSLEAVLLDDSLALSDQTASAIVKAYLQFADAYPKDSNAVDYLFKASDVMRGMYRYQDAVRTLELVVERYPESDKAPTALFYAGFILHNDTEQNNLAIPFFQKLIDEFPDHPLADDARNLMPLLNMNEEQLLEFLNRNKPS
jgi:tetratricopeptide (TPR) repeat protein